MISVQLWWKHVVMNHSSFALRRREPAARPECLRCPVVRLPNLRLSRPHLRRAFQTLERVRDAVVRAPFQAIQHSAPPPGREREVSAIAELTTARVDR